MDKTDSEHLDMDPGININQTWNIMLPKGKETRCQDDKEIDEIPSRQSTGLGSVTAPSLDT